MEQHIVKILSAQYVTHNVRQFKLEKPAGYTFLPGQATEIAINQPEWLNERRPFTFTSLNEWDHLEFTIKIYKDHSGVTNHLSTLQPGDELVLHDVWGAIQYKGEGTFIAGGAGITPFIAILRQLHKDGAIGNNRLLFANKTQQDIILKEELTTILGNNFVNILSEEPATAYEHGRIDEAWLRKHITDFKQHFYICGPDAMVQQLKTLLEKLGGSDTLVTVEL